MTRHLTLLFCVFSIVAGCAEEPPPRSVQEFVDNPIWLEAAMVRCAQDRSRTRYEAECVNARAAVDRIQAREEAAAKAELEARSESKRRALRRTQAAAAEARRRAAEEQRRREESDYLAQFGVSPDESDGAGVPEAVAEGNLPRAEVPQAPEQGLSQGSYDGYPAAPVGSNAPVIDVPQAPEEGLSQGTYDDHSTAPVGSNAPVARPEPESAETDLESVREELRRRNEEGGD